MLIIYNINDLIEFLPVLAKVCGGYATITNSFGKRISTYDSSGKVVEKMEDEFYPDARRAYDLQRPIMGQSEIIDEASAWFLPIGEYVLAASNIERIAREENLFRSLKSALSFIAQVTGGAAVIFNDKGERLFSVNQSGNIEKEYIGKVSKPALEAMKNQKPIIGKSTTVVGATAARIPITTKYGIGFNNEGSIMQKNKLMDQVNKENKAHYIFNDIVSQSNVMTHVKKFAGEVAKNDSSIVLFGETGTGKELFAQSIHNASSRNNNPFVAINCGALPPNLVESTLFGYVPGAFTGADKKGEIGLFEKASGGTLFLDEISEMEINLQTKLLRVLQEEKIRKIGDEKAIEIDVRIIASTNKNLKDLVKKGQFREDLFYRLNVVDIKIPPLRKRGNDIIYLLEHFISEFNLLFGKNVTEASDSVLKILNDYDWPGNVREFKNCIERIFNIIDGNTILVKHLPPYLTNNTSVIEVKQNDFQLSSEDYKGELDQILEETESKAIEFALKRNDYNRTKTAEQLGISKTTLWRRMKKHELI